jgi:enamine deaminase RidA (YjgF/YER057c/UK114 family)
MASSATARRICAPGMAEPPNATWSNCLVVGNDIVMSGVTAGLEPDENGYPLTTRAQAQRILGRIVSMVEAAGGTVGGIYKLVVYLTDINDKGVVSEIRREFFKEPYPCSTLVEIRALAFPAMTIEIDAFARLDCDLYQ